jgi:hypothetical protein
LGLIGYGPCEVIVNIRETPTAQLRRVDISSSQAGNSRKHRRRAIHRHDLPEHFGCQIGTDGVIKCH